MQVVLFAAFFLALGAGLVTFAVFNSRHDLNWRYSKWLTRHLFGDSALRRFSNLIEDSAVARLFYGPVSTALNLVVGALCIVGAVGLLVGYFMGAIR